MSRKLLLIGGGGHCRSVLDSVIAAGIYDEIGIIDQEEGVFYGASVIGTDDDIPVLMKEGWRSAVITVGSIGNTATRRRLYEMAKRLGLELPSVIDPSAVIARDAVIQEGCFVGKRAIINSGAVLGVCSIVNTGSIIEHECEIGAFSHISPGAVLCGQVKIGQDAHVGAGSVIRQQATVGEGALIGAGSVVVTDLPAGVKAFGNPCKVVE